ncbi:hypothetical protein [Arthrobacter sp. NPDC090010]|uniref:hypothetical protein n=1 Tax=Arthrobacter sp. NPDC090010 TaxID=3363942 RepID=UPI0038131012
MTDLATHLDIAGTAFTRIDSPDSIACWTATIASTGEDTPRAVSIVLEPAVQPDQRLLQFAAVVVSRFDEFADLAKAYLQQRLSEPEFGLQEAELSALRNGEPLFDEPEAVIWSDDDWMLRFTESRLELADPYGIAVLFEGTNPSAVEDLSDADPA